MWHSSEIYANKKYSEINYFEIYIQTKRHNILNDLYIYIYIEKYIYISFKLMIYNSGEFILTLYSKIFVIRKICQLNIQ